MVSRERGPIFLLVHHSRCAVLSSNLVLTRGNMPTPPAEVHNSVCRDSSTTVRMAPNLTHLVRSSLSTVGLSGFNRGKLSPLGRIPNSFALDELDRI